MRTTTVVRLLASALAGASMMGCLPHRSPLAAHHLTIAPAMRVEQVHTDDESRVSARVNLPVQWAPTPRASVAYALQAEAGRRAGNAPAFDHVVRAALLPRDGGLSAQTSWRAGRVSALDLAADSLGLGTRPGDITTLAPVVRLTTSSGVAWNSGNDGAIGWSARAALSTAAGLGDDRAATPSQSQWSVTGSRLSRASRIETREMRLQLVREARAEGSALHAVALSAGGDRRLTRRLSIGGAIGAQGGVLAASVGRDAVARRDVIGDIRTRWQAREDWQFSLAGATQVRLDAATGLARRQWRGEVGAQWRVTPAWRLSLRAQGMQLTGADERPSTRAAELAITHTTRQRRRLEMGLRTISLTTSAVARTLPYTGSNELRGYMAWTP